MKVNGVPSNNNGYTNNPAKIAENIEDLQKMVTRIAEYVEEYRLTMNIKKEEIDENIKNYKINENLTINVPELSKWKNTHNWAQSFALQPTTPRNQSIDRKSNCKPQQNEKNTQQKRVKVKLKSQIGALVRFIDMTLWKTIKILESFEFWMSDEFKRYDAHVANEEVRNKMNNEMDILNTINGYLKYD